MQRRTFIASSALCTLAPSGWVCAKETSLPKAHDLRTLAQQIGLQVKPDNNVQNQPIVLLASLPGCPYCELVRRSYLIPYKTEYGLLSWQLDTTDHGVLMDFAGQKTSPATWLKAMRIKITPTVLFMNAQGDEVVPRLEGVAVPDFYGAYLDSRLISARQKL